MLPTFTLVWNDTTGDSCRSSTMKCSPLGRVNSLTFFWSSWNSWAFLGGSWRSCADTSRPAERIREQRSRPRTIDNSFGQREVPTAFKRIASPSGGSTPEVLTLLLFRRKLPHNVLSLGKDKERNHGFHGAFAETGSPARCDRRRPSPGPAIPPATGAEMEAHPAASRAGYGDGTDRRCP